MNNAPPPGRTLLLAWAIIATLVGAVSSVLVVYMFLHRPQPPALTAAVSSPFIELREETVPGRYSWIENGQSNGVLTLLSDHSYLGTGGRRARDHRWEITRDALLIINATKIDSLNRLESPGVYSGFRGDGTAVRIEKLP